MMELDQPAVSGPVNATAEPAVAAASLLHRCVAARRHLDATEQLRREMRAMRTLLQTIVHNVVVATTMPSSRQNASVTSKDQRRRRHNVGSTTHATVAPLSTSVHGWTKPIDSSLPGIADVGLWEV